MIGLLLDKPTTMPPAGADALRVTVPVVGDPPVTVDGFSVSDLRKATRGFVIAAVFVTPE